jgi:hypothetical protein
LQREDIFLNTLVDIVSPRIVLCCIMGGKTTEPLAVLKKPRVKYIFKKTVCERAQFCLSPAGEKKIIKHTVQLALRFPF